MGETLGMDVVNRLDQLLGIVSDDALLEGARIRNVIEKLTPMHQLTDNVGDLNLLAIFLVPHGVLIELIVLYNVLVVECLHTLNLVPQQLERSLIELWVVQSEYLHCELLALRVCAQFHLGAEATAKSTAESVLSNGRSHI